MTQLGDFPVRGMQRAMAMPGGNNNGRPEQHCSDSAVLAGGGHGRVHLAVNFCSEEVD